MSAKIFSVVMAVVSIFWVVAAPSWGQDGELLLEVAQRKVRAFDITTKTAAGETFRLRDLRGRVVFLNFWATWCAPCRLEMPAMERLHQKLKGRPFTMLALNVDEPLVLVNKFIQDLNLTFTVLMDPGGEISETYSARNLPLTYIIDKKGNISRRAIGPREWDGPAALRLLEKLMAEEG